MHRRGPRHRHRTVQLVAVRFLSRCCVPEALPLPCQSVPCAVTSPHRFVPCTSAPFTPAKGYRTVSCPAAAHVSVLHAALFHVPCSMHRTATVPPPYRHRTVTVPSPYRHRTTIAVPSRAIPPAPYGSPPPRCCLAGETRQEDRLEAAAGPWIGAAQVQPGRIRSGEAKGSFIHSHAFCFFFVVHTSVRETVASAWVVLVAWLRESDRRKVGVRAPTFRKFT